MQDFRKLDIYRRAIKYCVNIYDLSTRFPKDEKYGLVSQIRRAVSSIPLNVSEGAGCGSNKEFSQFVSYAYRSCNEVLTCLELAMRLDLHKGNGEINELEKEGIELSRMLYAFLKKLDGST
ncbi:MAG: four helix bundle protein [Candidatus Omnitrophica bacterium]|nr:four helix bundle protein [Candidatus Omnitrophota bacterium]